MEPSPSYLALLESRGALRPEVFEEMDVSPQKLENAVYAVSAVVQEPERGMLLDSFRHVLFQVGSLLAPPLATYPNPQPLSRVPSNVPTKDDWSPGQCNQQ